MMFETFIVTEEEEAERGAGDGDEDVRGGAGR